MKVITSTTRPVDYLGRPRDTDFLMVVTQGQGGFTSDIKCFDANGAPRDVKPVFLLDPQGDILQVPTIADLEFAANVLSSIAAAASLTIPTDFTAVTVLGYATAGDGGGGTYLRVGTQPTHAGKFQDASGAWFELAAQRPSVKMFGAKGDGVTLDHLAFQRAVNYAAAKGGANIYVPRGTYMLGNPGDGGAYAITLLNVNNIVIEGDGPGVTVLKVANNANVGPIVMNTVVSCGVKNLTLDGNRQNQTVFGLHGVKISLFAYDVKLQNVDINYAAGYGLAMQADLGEASSFQRIWCESVKILSPNTDGTDIKNRGGSNDSIVMNNITVIDCGDDKASIDIRGRATLSNIHIKYTTGRAAATGVRFRNDNDNSASSLPNTAGGKYSSLTNFVIDMANGANSSGIAVVGPHVHISNGTILRGGDSSSGNGIYMSNADTIPDTGAHHCTVVGVSAVNCYNGFNDAGLNNVFIGCTTEGTINPSITGSTTVSVGCAWANSNQNFIGAPAPAPVNPGVLQLPAGSTNFALSIRANSSSERKVAALENANGVQLTQVVSGNNVIERSGNGSEIVRKSNNGLEVSTGFAPLTDNVISCGASGKRFTAVWATNGVIQTSDERLKRDITPSQLGLSFVLAQRPVSFRWKDDIDDEKVHFGLIAQEVKASLPANLDFAGWQGEENGPQALNYGEFIAPILAAIQELAARLVKLES